MSSDFWFLDREGNRRGSVGEEEIVRMIGEGAIRRETLIWTAGMKEWRNAGQVEGFSTLFNTSEPPSLPLDGGVSRMEAKGALSSSFSVWSLFGRSLLVLIGLLLIVPSPWTSTSFYRWMCEHTALPDGRRLTFVGKPEDIWWVFIALGVIFYAPFVFLIFLGHDIPGSLFLRFPLEWILSFVLLKWICANARSEDGRVKLSFQGSLWSYIGWNLLWTVSVITIIGWAWVVKFMNRWICRNVQGTMRFEFTGNGLSILWRTLIFALFSCFVIPIPWVLHWYTRWYISQVSVTESRANEI